MSVLKCLAAVSAMVVMPIAMSASAAPAKLAADTVVATQGGVQVTLADVDAFSRTVPADHLAELFNSPKRIESIVRNLLAQKQLLNEAHKLKLQDKPQVAADMQQAADAVLIKARIAVLRDKVVAEVPDLSELAHERYLANPADYAVPKQVDVKHILIGTKDRSDAEAKALAVKIYKQLEADPSQYDADVEKYSDDQSKSRNQGLITNATSNKLVPEFREAADKLTKVGEIAPPVKSQFGYHIIKLVKLTPGHTSSYAEVKDAIVKELRDNYIAKKVQHHLDLVRNRSIDAVPAAVASLRNRYATPDTSFTPTKTAASKKPVAGKL
ncbi:MAG: peptidylprolyl isomerase [Xanthomonadales bacterium]|nr:peptidylprolyl isomerase [Xanthomonadales bacterium]